MKNTTNALSEIYWLEKSILAGRVSKKKLEKEFERIEAKYGKDAFNPCKVIEQPKPWNKETLETLHELFQFGCQSKECLRYAAEVAAVVYGRTRKKIVVTAAAVVGGSTVAITVGRHFIK